MKYFICVALLFTGAVAAIAQTDRGRDERAIRVNVEQLEKGWNTKSGVEFAKPFAEDSDYVVIDGVHIKGRKANAAGHQQIFDTAFKDSSLKLTVESIRFLTPEIAVVHVLAELTARLGDPTSKGKARSTQVMKKSGGKWEIAAFQNTEMRGGQPSAPRPAQR